MLVVSGRSGVVESVGVAHDVRLEDVVEPAAFVELADLLIVVSDHEAHAGWELDAAEKIPYLVGATLSPAQDVQDQDPGGVILEIDQEAAGLSSRAGLEEVFCLVALVDQVPCSIDEQQLEVGDAGAQSADVDRGFFFERDGFGQWASLPTMVGSRG